MKIPALLILLLALPAFAEACPVCFAAKEGTRQAFVSSTVFLTLLPLLMLGGAFYWLKKQFARQSDTSE